MKGKKIFNELKGYLERHSTFELADEFNLTELAFYFQIFYESSRKLSDSDLLISYVFRAGKRKGSTHKEDTLMKVKPMWMYWAMPGE